MIKNIYKNNKQKGLFFYINNILSKLNLLLDLVFVRYTLLSSYIFLLIVLSIANTHYSEKFTRQLLILEEQVSELKVSYTSLQAEYMASIKESEVARRVQQLGLIQSIYPPFKIKK